MKKPHSFHVTNCDSNTARAELYYESVLLYVCHVNVFLYAATHCVEKVMPMNAIPSYLRCVGYYKPKSIVVKAFNRWRNLYQS